MIDPELIAGALLIALGGVAFVAAIFFADYLVGGARATPLGRRDQDPGD